MLAALLALAAAGAAAQQREQLPIQLKASSLNFDSQEGLVEYGEVTITQGEISITADRAVTTGVDFEDSSWEFEGNVRIDMPDSKIASDSLRGAMARIGGFESCQPSAPSRATNVRASSILKRTSGSFPHHPARRGSAVLAPWRAWTKQPATAPGPALRYL